MAGDKFLYNNAGALTEKAAIQSSGGAGDAGKIPALDSGGRIDNSMMPVGLGAETDAFTASEALSAGDFVNTYASTGAKCRKADGSAAGKPANGFVLAAVNQSDPATVYRGSQLNNQRTGMTPGASQYLSPTVPGGITETVPTGSGQVVQFLGIAKSATELVFQPREPIVLA